MLRPVTIVTSFSAKGYQSYGRRFLDSWAQNVGAIPEHLVVYVEEQVESLPLNAVQRRLDFLPKFNDFMARYGLDRQLAGRVEMPCWKQKDRRLGYSYRTDALKFCRKVFAIADAARQQGTGLMAWLDADTVAFKPVPPGWFQSIIELGDVTYLGRGRAHSECGFVGFQLPTAMPLISKWEDFYAQGTVRALPEFHDSYLFDRAREQTAGFLNAVSIAKPNDVGHVWVRSPLGDFFDHLKGDRKRLGYSPERVGENKCR